MAALCCNEVMECLFSSDSKTTTVQETDKMRSWVIGWKGKQPRTSSPDAVAAITSLFAGRPILGVKLSMLDIH